MTPIEEDIPPEESEEEEEVDAGVTQGTGRTVGNSSGVTQGAGGSAGNSYKPKKPKFGGISQTGPDSYSAWTGGKPKSSWLELEKQPTSIRPNQYRPTNITGQAKSQAYRRQGLKTEFTREKDLQTFENDVMKHVEDFGMDTITYIPDPADATKLDKQASRGHQQGKAPVGYPCRIVSM